MLKGGAPGTHRHRHLAQIKAHSAHQQMEQTRNELRDKLHAEERMDAEKKARETADQGSAKL